MKPFVASLTLLSLLSPLGLLAQEEGVPTPITSTRIERGAPLPREARKDEARQRIASSTQGRVDLFCQNIDKALLALDTQTIKLDDKKAKNVERRENKKEDTRNLVDQKRTENDAKRKSVLEELSKRATTDAQKEAILNFQKAMDQALTIKKESMDTILAAHRTEVDSATDNRKKDIEKALQNLKTDIEKAKAKAKESCTQGLSGEQIKKELRASVEKARQDFRTAVQGIEKVKTVSEESKNLKKEELKKIEDTFKSSVEKARNDLKAALKNG